MSCCKDAQTQNKNIYEEMSEAYGPSLSMGNRFKVSSPIDWYSTPEMRRQHEKHTRAAVAMLKAEFPDAEKIDVTLAQQRYAVRMDRPPTWLLLRGPKNGGAAALLINNMSNRLKCPKCGRFLRFEPFWQTFARCKISNPRGYTARFDCQPRMVEKRQVNGRKAFLPIPPENGCIYHAFTTQSILEVRDLVKMGALDRLILIEGEV